MEKRNRLEIFVGFESGFILYIDSFFGRSQFVCSNFLIKEVVAFELVALISDPLIVTHLTTLVSNPSEGSKYRSSAACEDFCADFSSSLDPLSFGFLHILSLIFSDQFGLCRSVVCEFRCLS